MLIKHVRDYYGKPFATIVHNGENIGVSICSPKDSFNKALGIRIAKGRADKNVDTHVPNRLVYCNNTHYDHFGDDVVSMYEVLNFEYEFMKSRATRYYKERVSG